MEILFRIACHLRLSAYGGDILMRLNLAKWSWHAAMAAAEEAKVLMDSALDAISAAVVGR